MSTLSTISLILAMLKFYDLIQISIFGVLAPITVGVLLKIIVVMLQKGGKI